MYNIPISSVVRRALEEEIRKREEELKRKLAEAQAILGKIPEASTGSRSSALSE